MKGFISLRKSEDVAQTHVERKSAYIVENPPDSFVDVLKVANIDFFPKLFLIGAISPIRFTEAERAASGIRSSKSAFTNAVKDDQEIKYILLVALMLNKYWICLLKKNQEN